jgi:hypothetical protein
MGTPSTRGVSKKRISRIAAKGFRQTKKRRGSWEIQRTPSSKFFVEVWRLFLDEHSITRKRVDHLLIVTASISLLYMPWSLAFWSYVEKPHMTTWRHLELLSDIVFLFAAITETLTRTQAAKDVSQTENRKRKWQRSATGMDMLKKSGVKTVSGKLGRSIPKLGAVKLERTSSGFKLLEKGSMKALEMLRLGIQDTDQYGHTVAKKKTNIVLLWLSALPFQYFQLLDIPLHQQRWLQLINILKLYRFRAASQHYHRLQFISQFFGPAVNLLRVLASLIYYAHFAACLFFFIGVLQADEAAWVHTLMPSGCEFGNDRFEGCPSLGYMYLSCLYWSMTTTLSSESQMELVIITSWDRVFVLVVVTLGSIFVAVIFGAVFEAYEELHADNRRWTQQISTVGG